MMMKLLVTRPIPVAVEITGASTVCASARLPAAEGHLDSVDESDRRCARRNAAFSPSWHLLGLREGPRERGKQRAKLQSTDVPSQVNAVRHVGAPWAAG